MDSGKVVYPRNLWSSFPSQEDFVDFNPLTKEDICF